jgi:hypothetical protein
MLDHCKFPSAAVAIDDVNGPGEHYVDTRADFAGVQHPLAATKASRSCEGPHARDLGRRKHRVSVRAWVAQFPARPSLAEQRPALVEFELQRGEATFFLGRGLAPVQQPMLLAGEALDLREHAVRCRPIHYRLHAKASVRRRGLTTLFSRATVSSGWRLARLLRRATRTATVFSRERVDTYGAFLASATDP